jgi:hypothetical protein
MPTGRLKILSRHASPNGGKASGVSLGALNVEAIDVSRPIPHNPAFIAPPARKQTTTEPAMPTGQPLCPRCNDNLFVRTEHIISGRRVMQAFYCGRCIHEWQIESASPTDEERRKAERRRTAQAPMPKRDRRRLG